MSTNEPLTNNDAIIDLACQWFDENRKIAMATVIETWNSAPRPCGSRLLIDENGNFQGSVSGGCIESAVVTEALEVIASQQHKELHFGVSDEDAWEVGLACGGKITILVEAIDKNSYEILVFLSKSLKTRNTVTTITELATNEKTVVKDSNKAGNKFKTAVEIAQSKDKASVAIIDDVRFFIEAFNPNLKLLIIGAVHVSQALVPLAKQLGMQCIVIDPRESWANEKRFFNVGLVCEWPDVAIDKIGIDSRTAIATLSHDPKIDNPALEKALVSDALYIGALGSTRTHAKRVAYLIDKGFDQKQIARIHAPIGLDIKATSAAEIALSIVAELVLIQRSPHP